MKFSVVVPTFNRQASLRQTLAAMMPLGALALWVRLGMVVWVSIVSQIKRAVQITVPHIKKFLAAFFPIRNLLSSSHQVPSFNIIFNVY
jgi:hypothetical protein